MKNSREHRLNFFKGVFGWTEGYACVVVKDIIDDAIEHSWYHWPQETKEMLDFIESRLERQAHFWFATALYDTPGDRHRSNAKTSTLVHVDLDECSPNLLLVPPSFITQTSPGKYQAFWKLDRDVEPTVAEEINTRIAYAHREQGADMCHDAGHLMRIPYTPNYKYGGAPDDIPIVAILDSVYGKFRTSEFNCYPAVKAIRFLEKSDELPDVSDLDTDDIQARYATSLDDGFYTLYYTTPAESDGLESRWSGALWSLMQKCVEAGLNKRETFVLATNASCNKFARDGKPPINVWQDVNRAFLKHMEKMQLAPTNSTENPDFLTEQETVQVQQRETFIERYIEWAKDITDAPVQYHQAGAFITLSSLLAGSTYVATSHERVYPNMWFMILAGTTLTRKSTAMRTAMSLVKDVYPEAEMATDGSVEGLLSALQDRAGQPSIFLRDEFTGLLDSIANKDYMAGFAEQLTKLYDGDGVKRLLRKEVIDVRDPRFIIFAAGIKSKTQELLTEEHVLSGFIPRFVFISADAKIENIRLTRPPSQEINHDARELLKNELVDMWNHYDSKTVISRNGQAVGTLSTQFEASLTPEAWARYNIFERAMMDTAQSSGLDFLMPVYVRLTVSTLKAALLIAASRQREQGVIVEELDILHAIYYCQRWREYASEIINGVGKTYDERVIDKIFSYVGSSTSGVTRAELMKVFRLDMKRADLMFGTMVQRNMIYRLEVSGQTKYRRVGVA